MWWLDFRVRTYRCKGGVRTRIGNLALHEPLPPSEPASRQICECEIWWRPIVEERLHLAEHILGSLFFKSGQCGLGKRYRESCLRHRIGQDIFRGAIAIQCWNREAQLARYNQDGSCDENNSWTNQTEPCQLDCIRDYSQFGNQGGVQ